MLWCNILLEVVVKFLIHQYSVLNIMMVVSSLDDVLVTFRLLSSILIINLTIWYLTLAEPGRFS